MTELTLSSMILRVVLSICVSGVIGYERQQKNRPAGIKTHVLVCLGATIIAILQQEIANESLIFALNNPNNAGVVRSDPARLIAQVISGIGFLGAGTIIVTKKDVKGLTTAASIWVVACLGLSIGMGYFMVSIIGFLAILFSLTIIKKIVRVPKYKRLEIFFTNREDTKKYIHNYFKDNHIQIDDVIFESYESNHETICKNVFTIDIPKTMSYAVLVEDLSLYENISKIRMISIE